MITQTIYDAYTKIDPFKKNRLINFLLTNQEDGVSKNDIQSAIEYAVKEVPSFGGFILTAEKDEKIVAALIVNQTGMSGYSPKNILVCYGISKSVIRSNIGRDILQKAIKFANKDIAFHISPSHPALSLFKSLGFTADYLEMRFTGRPHKSTA